MYKNVFKTGIVIYVIAVILAVCFYLERTAFIDIAFHLFFILKTGTFTIQKYRFGALLTQLFPVLSAKSNLSLQSICILYSASFIIIPFIYYLLAARFDKECKWSIILLLFLILFTSHTFFWIQSELPQGIAFTIFYFSLFSYIQSRYPGYFTFLVSAIGSIIIAFFHPLLIFIFFFITLYLILHQSNKKFTRYLLTGLGLYISVVVTKQLFFQNTYDSAAMGGAKKILSTFPNYFNLDSNIRFLYNSITKYIWMNISLITLIYFYIKRKSWKKLTLLLFFFFSYLLLVNVSYPDNRTQEFYIENLYLPLGIFLSVPLVFDLLPAIKSTRLPVLFALVGISFFVRIYTVSYDYTSRLSWLKEILVKYKGDKIALQETNRVKERLKISWGTPYEFWIISTITDNKSASGIIFENVSSISADLDKTNALLTYWGSLNYDELPNRYFKFNDTVTGYKIVTE